MIQKNKKKIHREHQIIVWNSLKPKGQGPSIYFVPDEKYSNTSCTLLLPFKWIQDNTPPFPRQMRLPPPPPSLNRTPELFLPNKSIDIL